MAKRSEDGHEKAWGAIVNAIENLVAKIPKTDERESDDPLKRARSIINKAAAKAAIASGGLALPAGPLGMLTIVPDLLAVWKIQRQMISDIAGVFGKEATLSREQMLYCLFKHAAAQLMRDIIVRVGERVLIKRASFKALREVMEKVAVKVTQRLVGKSVSRWLPIVGAVGVGAYAFYDTAQVGKTAIELFQSKLEFEDK